MIDRIGTTLKGKRASGGPAARKAKARASAPAARKTAAKRRARK